MGVYRYRGELDPQFFKDFGLLQARTLEGNSFHFGEFFLLDADGLETALVVGIFFLELGTGFRHLFVLDALQGGPGLGGFAVAVHGAYIFGGTLVPGLPAGLL